MKILDYEYHGPDWDIQKVRFQDINLLVGDSGTGKTRVLNTIFNLGTFVAQGKLGGKGDDKWDLSLKINDDVYKWHISIVDDADEIIVQKEILFLNEEKILERDSDVFSFEKEILPKVRNTEPSLFLLKETESIKPLYDGFAKMLRRRFFDDDIARNSSVISISLKHLDRIGKTKNLNKLYKANLGLNPRLYILKNYFPDIYKEIIRFYVETFDFISDVKILNSDDLDSMAIPPGLPVFCIKEKNISTWLGLHGLSSGMQKVLLILTDLLSLPKGSIYLIDEYENSIGVGALEFLPNLISYRDIPIQIILTSHHPYIIREIPVEYWYVAYRKGSKVQFDYGDELVKRYGVSSQDKYIQLLNDPIYSEGVE